jgi:AraC family transcriptional activator FtrA
MHVVAAVIDQGALTFDFAIPCEVFGLDRSDIVDPWYGFRVVSAGERKVRLQTGFTVDAPYGLDALGDVDTIVVPGWSDPEDEPSAALKESLVAAYERGARIASLCTGAFVLAASGLLDGRRATTHWMYAKQLERRYPRAYIDPSVLYVAEDRVMTSAGTAAGIDLCLHLVALDHGVEVAAAVARRLVMPLFRSGGQAQYVDGPIVPDPGGLSALLDWGRTKLDTGIGVDDLARQAAMSPRTLTRRFRSAVGVPPGDWIQHERLRLAQRLLERTDDSIEAVARRAGYDSVVTMRAQFAARLHTSPRAYRLTFRGRAGAGTHASGGQSEGSALVAMASRIA